MTGSYTERAAKNNFTRNFFLTEVALILFFLLPFLSASGQGAYQLRILPLDASPDFLEKQIKYRDEFSDSLGVVRQLKDVISQLHNRAFLEASVDTLTVKDSVFVALLHLGKTYAWARLANGNVEKAFLEQVGFRERLYSDKPFSIKQLRKLQEGLLGYAENNGYPFARVWLDSILIEEGQVAALLFMEKNRLVTLNPLKIEGDAKIRSNYLSNYLGLKEGGLYDRSKVIRIRDRLRELPFMGGASDPTVTFEGERATINLNLAKKRASRFDFLIGVLPNSRQVGRMLITGTFNGELQNQFGLGERIYAEFERLRPETQELDLQFNYPYVLDLPFGADLKFNLYKRDTSYLDLEYDIGVQYLFEGGNYLKGFLNNRSSVLLTVDENRLVATQRLPDNLDVTNAGFGLEYLFQRLDYRFNPRKGWSAFIRAGAGIKRIKRNNRIVELDYGSLYDTLQLRTFQYRILSRLEGYLPVFGRGAVKGAVQSGSIIAQGPVYFNEQFRIGGNRLLRGFDEEFIFATHYAVGTLEYRYLIGENSYINLFGDYAYVQDKTSNKDEELFPLGFGAGITFETRAGLFGLSLAFGKLRDEPIDFGAPKVHFGYVSLF